MNLDRFKDFDPDVRDLVLAFESQKDGHRFFDVDQLEIIADYYLEVADVEGLEAAVKFGEELYPTNDEIKLRRAHFWSVTGHHQQALRLLKELEKKSPDDTDVCYSLGALYGLTGKPRKAIEYYLRAASDGFELGLIYGNIAEEYCKLDQYNHAIKYYIKANAAKANDERILTGLSYAWMQTRNFQHGIQYFRQLVNDQPYSQWAWYGLGYLYTCNMQHDQAAEAFEYALAIDKTMFDAYIGLSQCYRALDKVNLAVQALRDALPYADDHAGVIAEIGDTFVDIRNYHTAITYYRDSLKEDPSRGTTWSALGYCCDHLGFTQEAEDYLKHAVDIDPDDDYLWLDLADFYIRHEDYRHASAVLERSCTDAYFDFYFYVRLINCYQHMGRTNKMLHILRALTQRYPDLKGEILNSCPNLANDIDAMTILSSDNHENE